MGISSMLWAGFGDMLLNLFACIPKLMYLLATSFLSILDVLQLLVRKLAGLDSYYIDGELQSGDIVEDLITGIVTNRYPALNNVFWSFIILGVIILFVTTIIALIRNEYTPEKDGSNSKSKVMGRTFKAVLTFCIVPIATMFGVYLCNVVLQAMDSVSSGQTAASIALDTDLLRHETINVGGREVEAWSCYNLFGARIYTTTTPFSGLVFKVGAYNANRVRTTQGTDLEYSGSGTITGTRDFYALLQMTTDGATNMGGLFTGGANDHEEVATKIDEAFANNVVLLTPQVVNYPDGYVANHNLASFDLITGAQTLLLQSGNSVDSLNRFNTALVWYYYDLWNFNIILAFGAGIIMIAIFINIIFGLMRRIIECVALFLISPSLAAIMPLDDGNAFKKWSGRFIGKILSAYGAVIGLNLIMIILPYITTINFFNIPLVDTIIDTLFVIVGLVIVKGFMKMLSELIGADDAQSMGGDVAKEVGQRAAQSLKLTGAAAGVALASTAVLPRAALGTAGMVYGSIARDIADENQRPPQGGAPTGGGGAASRLPSSGASGGINPTLKSSIDLAAGKNLKAASGLGTKDYKTWKKAHPDEYAKALEDEKRKIEEGFASVGGTGTSAPEPEAPTPRRGNPGWGDVGAAIGNSYRNSNRWYMRAARSVGRFGGWVAHTAAPAVKDFGRAIGVNQLGRAVSSFVGYSGDAYRSTDFYKGGWKDAGGLEDVGYSSRGISAKKVADYKKLKSTMDEIETKNKAEYFVKNNIKPKL